MQTLNAEINRGKFQLRNYQISFVFKQSLIENRFRIVYYFGYLYLFLLLRQHSRHLLCIETQATRFQKLHQLEPNAVECA